MWNNRFDWVKRLDFIPPRNLMQPRKQSMRQKSIRTIKPNYYALKAIIFFLSEIHKNFNVKYLPFHSNFRARVMRCLLQRVMQKKWREQKKKCSTELEFSIFKNMSARCAYTSRWLLAKKMWKKCHFHRNNWILFNVFVSFAQTTYVHAIHFQAL